MVSKEFVEERRGFGLAYTANHLDRMIQTSVTHHIAYRPASPRFWIPRAKHEPWDARQNNRARAHGAWFERDGEGAAIKAPCASAAAAFPRGSKSGCAGGALFGSPAVEPVAIILPAGSKTTAPMGPALGASAGRA